MTRLVASATVLCLLAFGASANHPDDSCPDNHIADGESLDLQVTIRDTGLPVSDGMTVKTGTYLRWNMIATAYGRCEIFNSIGGQCVTGLVFERNVNHIVGKLNADTTSLKGNYEAFNVFGKNPNGITAFYNVLDTNDLTRTSGPPEELLYGAGRYTYTVTNIINSTICKVSPDRVVRKLTVYAHDFTTDEDLGCGKDGNAAVGNPCHVKTGNKYQREVDADGDVLPLVRHYNSKITSIDFGLGHGWLSPYLRRLEVYPTATGAEAHYRRGDGYGEPFTRSGTTWSAETDSNSRLVEDSTGYTVNYLTRSHDRFDLNGRLLSSTDEAGVTVDLTYDGNGKLQSVLDDYGHQLLFTFNSDGRVSSIDRSGSVYSFTYDSNGNLTRITYPDSTARDYVYENTSYPHHLTGIFDESGIRWGTYTYDSNGRATASQHPGGAGDVSLTYTNSGATSVTDALGVARTFTHSKIKGAYRVTSVSGTSCSWCKPNKAATYDSNANVTSTTDWLNQKTCYAYDTSRNLETIRIEGFAPGLSCPANLSTYVPTAGTRQRKITTQWHSTFALPIQVDEPGRRTLYMYDAAGNQLTRTLLDTTTSESRIWTYTYDSAQRMLTADGPRTDASDVTTYAYYSCTTGSQCGQLHTVTNALGHVTTYDSYNAQGLPLTIVDPNGLVTTLTYDARSRLASATVGTEQTTLEYWPTGKLKTVTAPDGSSITYTYDAAHRLTGITDSSGNSILYTLDAMGNRTGENIYDPSSTLARTRTRIFDTANRLWKSIGAAGTTNVTTTYSYDNNENLTSIAGPLSRTSNRSFDELGRLTHLTDPLSGTVQYGYNALDQLTSVTDPRSKVTTYAFNALGDLLQQLSPDTGTTSMTYDSGGNLKTVTDARSKTATYSYDALNRITSAVYPDQTITYTYDSGGNQQGRLTQITDNTGSTSWTYDTHGRVTSRQQGMGITKSLAYAYDSYGRLQTLTLPSGNFVTYGYTNGEITSLALNGVTTILTDVLYQAFGPTHGWTWGNSTAAIREYDLDGKVTGIDSSGLTTYDYDDAFRITNVTDSSNTALSQAYGYDALDRLTSATGTTVNQSWTYDANGNRLSQGGAQSSVYTIAATSNRLDSASGALTRTYQYDPAGNVTSDGATTFSYNDAGRMVASTKGGVTTLYGVNALGQRVTKTTGGSARYFFYDDGGRIVGEYDASGALIQETIWLGGVPVATIHPNGASVSLYYIHTDHLNTPRRITRPSDNVIVWRWDSDPFGTSLANQDPDGDANDFLYNLRFMGQYFDTETELHYNYFRDYDPSIGRYVQSDPNGLRGGFNTYAYVRVNPLRLVDPFGLEDQPPGDFQVDPSTGFEVYAAVDTASEVSTPTPETPSDTTGAGEKAQQACDAAADAANEEARADEYRRSGHWDKYYDRMGRGWRHWRRYYRLIDQPLPTTSSDTAP